jgi:hypothetical protein
MISFYDKVSSRILGMEESVIGKPLKRYISPSNGILFSILSFSFSLMASIYLFTNYVFVESSGEWSPFYEILLNSSFKIILYSLLTSTSFFFLSFFIISSILKLTFIRNTGTALLGIFSAWIIFSVTSSLGHFIFIEADWDVVWQGRLLLLFGQQMFEAVTQSYYPNQSWRLWSVLYLVYIVIPSLLESFH